MHRTYHAYFAAVLHLKAELPPNPALHEKLEPDEAVSLQSGLTYRQLPITARHPQPDLLLWQGVLPRHNHENGEAKEDKGIP